VARWTREQAREVAKAIVAKLTADDRRRFKAIDVLPRLHAGMLTIRLYFVNQQAGEPESFLFPREEILGQ